MRTPPPAVFRKSRLARMSGELLERGILGTLNAAYSERSQ